MKIVEIPLNCGALSKRNGIEKASKEIIKDFEELFLNEDFQEPDYEIEEIKINNSNIDEAHKSVEKELPKVFEKTEKVEKLCILGGDHSLTYSTIKSLKQKGKLDRTLFIIFDAHPDLEDSTQSHEDYLRNLINENFIVEKDICLIGLRSFSKNEVSFLKKKKIRYYNMREVSEKGILKVAKEILNLGLKYKQFYLSIDIDVVDPAFAPGTGYIEPGGLTSRELLTIVQALKRKTKVFEIVEVNPEKDINRMTTKLAAKIVWELY